MNSQDIIEALVRAANKHPNIKGVHAKLAELSHVPQPTVTRVLNGDGDTRLSNIIKIATACGLAFRVDEKSIRLVGGAPDAEKLADILETIEQFQLENPAYNEMRSPDKALLIRRMYVLPENSDLKTELAEIIELSEALRRK